MITANLRGIEKKVQDSEEDIHSLRNTLDQLERKDSLRINGLPENDRENISDVISKFIRNALEVACKSEHISDVSRIENLYPESILVKFLATSKRNEVYFS
ncbi:hypothetical protein JTB14_027935 [Gonioctena quinquepunctata]|nr:hypothetical protein JTB14_027935 [Gonioctena quinquepunctata]